MQELYSQIGFFGIMFEGKYRFTKQQVSRYFDVDVRTIERLLENYSAELNESGYELFTGIRLKELRIVFNNALTAGNDYVTDIDVGDILESPENELALV